MMCKPGSVGGLGGQPPRSTRPGILPRTVVISKPEFMRGLSGRDQRLVGEVPHSFTGWLDPPRAFFLTFSLFLSQYRLDTVVAID